MCDAVKRYGRIWQTGSQQRSDYTFRRGAELVRNGRLGKILKIEVGLLTGGATDVKIQPVPEGLDWNFLAGAGAVVPYRGVSHWTQRWIPDYSGGQLTDWAGHHIDIATGAWGWDDRAGGDRRPRRVSEGRAVQCPDELQVRLQVCQRVVMTVGDGSQAGWDPMDRREGLDPCQSRR
jgi:predicted dehydrogenase